MKFCLHSYEMIIFVIISQYKQTKKKRPLWGGFVDLVEFGLLLKWIEKMKK